MPTRIAVVYYSATGNLFMLASAIAEGAASEGAEVRLRKVRELAAEEVIAANPRWVAHREATADIPEASIDDLEWADGFAFGSPTRFGLPAAPLKLFLDQTGGLWMRKRPARQGRHRVHVVVDEPRWSRGDDPRDQHRALPLGLDRDAARLQRRHRRRDREPLRRELGVTEALRSRRRRAGDGAVAGAAAGSCQRGGRDARNAANSHDRLIVNPSCS